MSTNYNNKEIEGCLKPVESSHIASVGHIQESNTLFVRFKTGITYSYTPVTHQAYILMMQADSQGKWLHKNIKGNKDIEYKKL